MKLPSVRSREFREWTVALIGALLVVSMYMVNSNVTANRKANDGGRSLVCLQLKAQGQPVEQYAPCMRPSVYKQWKDEPIATLEERLCATGAQVEGCDRRD